MQLEVNVDDPAAGNSGIGDASGRSALESRGEFDQDESGDDTLAKVVANMGSMRRIPARTHTIQPVAARKTTVTPAIAAESPSPRAVPSGSESLPVAVMRKTGQVCYQVLKLVMVNLLIFTKMGVQLMPSMPMDSNSNTTSTRRTAARTTTRKVRYSVRDLPLPPCDPYYSDMWRNRFVPSLLAWAGSLRDPFGTNIKLNDEVSNLWKRVFPDIVIRDASTSMDMVIVRTVVRVFTDTDTHGSL